MIQIILLVVGIIYAVRRPRLRALTNADYPGVPADRFEQWKALELKSITVFLWATWGLLLIGTPITLVFATRFPGGALGIQALYLVLFLILLLFSAIPGTQAARLKKELGIRWPRK